MTVVGHTHTEDRVRMWDTVVNAERQPPRAKTPEKKESVEAGKAQTTADKLMVWDASVNAERQQSRNVPAAPMGPVTVVQRDTETIDKVDRLQTQFGNVKERVERLDTTMKDTMERQIEQLEELKQLDAAQEFWEKDIMKLAKITSDLFNEGESTMKAFEAIQDAIKDDGGRIDVSYEKNKVADNALTDALKQFGRTLKDKLVDSTTEDDLEKQLTPILDNIQALTTNMNNMEDEIEKVKTIKYESTERQVREAIERLVTVEKLKGTLDADTKKIIDELKKEVGAAQTKIGRWVTSMRTMESAIKTLQKEASRTKNLLKKQGKFNKSLESPFKNQEQAMADMLTRIQANKTRINALEERPTRVVTEVGVLPGPAGPPGPPPPPPRPTGPLTEEAMEAYLDKYTAEEKQKKSYTPEEEVAARVREEKRIRELEAKQEKARKIKEGEMAVKSQQMSLQEKMISELQIRLQKIAEKKKAGPVGSRVGKTAKGTVLWDATQAILEVETALARAPHDDRKNMLTDLLKRRYWPRGTFVPAHVEIALSRYAAFCISSY